MGLVVAPGERMNMPEKAGYQEGHHEGYQRGTNWWHHAISRYVTLCMPKPLNDNDPQA